MVDEGTNLFYQQLQEESEQKTDPNIDHPKYYNEGTIEAIDAIDAATFGLYGGEAFCIGSAIKYLFRFKHKNNPVQDLKKAVWYIKRVISIYERGKNE